jgi:hypothetical protein
VEDKERLGWLVDGRGGVGGGLSRGGENGKSKRMALLGAHLNASLIFDLISVKMTRRLPFPP